MLFVMIIFVNLFVWLKDEAYGENFLRGFKNRFQGIIDKNKLYLER